MMTRKKRNLIIIIIAIIIILIASSVIGVLYIKTDFLKPNNLMFAKYVSQNFETIENILDMKTEEDCTNLLKQNNYEYKSKISTEYIESYDTNYEKKDDLINDITLDIDGKVDNSDNIKYANIKVNDRNDEIIGLEYMYQNNEMYSLKFSNIFKQYISIENNDLKELAEKLGFDSSSIPDKIPENINILQLINFTDEEKATLKNTYSNLILGNISQDKFTKQRDAIITVNEKSITTNAYILKLTKEELNNIYINILETLKQDQIILSKIDNIENVVYQHLNNNEDNIGLKETFLENIDTEIQNIQDTNIGQDEIKFTVYESEGITIRTSIESVESQIIIDMQNTQETQNLNVQKTAISEEEDIERINISKVDTSNSYNLLITLEQNNNNIKNKMQFNREIITNNNNISTNTQISYNDSDSKITINYSKDNNILSNELEIEVIEENNNVILNNYSSEQLAIIFTTVEEQIHKILNEKVSGMQERFNDSILNLGNINTDDITVEDTNGMSEVEKNRFNAKFEFYEAEETTYENAEKLLAVVSENLGSIEVLSGTEIKLNIEKGKEDKQTVEDILGVMSIDRKYKIEINYDENNLINNIILTILKNA